jgi:RNA polymerase sigma-70 factor (ECF subfamily)
MKPESATRQTWLKQAPPGKAGGETQLLRGLQEGDREAYALLVERYSGMIYRLALKLLNDPQSAEDVLQETFIKVLKKIGSFDGRSKLSTWLYRIATNEALMVLRRRQPIFLSLEDSSSEEHQPYEPVHVVDWCCLPEEELLSAEAREYLNAATEQLSPALRIVFILRDIEGLSTRESAEILSISEVAVRTRLLRARLRLRELLSSYYQERMKDT